MASSSRKWAGAIGAGMVVLALIVWLANRRPATVARQAQPLVTAAPPSPKPSTVEVPHIPPTSQPAIPGPIRADVSAPTPVAELPVTEPNPAPIIPDPVPPRPSDLPSIEVAATVRMYTAHASLRAPEVADPESVANRQILHAMVAKAIVRSHSTDESTPHSPSR